MFKFGRQNQSPNRRQPQAQFNRNKNQPLMDPVLYLGDLDEAKYPRLSQKENDNIKREEIENPLNKR